MEYSKEKFCKSILNNEVESIKTQLNFYLLAIDDLSDKDKCFKELENEFKALSCIKNITMLDQMLWTEPPKKEIFIESSDNNKYYITINVYDDLLKSTNVKVN